MSDSPERRLLLDGCHNLRDVGGYPAQDGRQTGWRILFRSDNLDRLTPASQDKFLTFGIQNIIDLRTSSELERFPDVFANSQVVNYHHLPFHPDDYNYEQYKECTALYEVYIGLLEFCQSEIKTILQTIATFSSGATLIHCAVGKDRTGLITALLLGLVGVSPEIIARDYALTAEYLAEPVARWRAKAIESGQNITRFDRDLSADAQTMLDTLAYLDNKYGGIKAYLGKIGLTAEELVKLTEWLLV